MCITSVREREALMYKIVMFHGIFNDVQTCEPLRFGNAFSHKEGGDRQLESVCDCSLNLSV